MLLASLHILSVPITRHVKPFLPSRRVRILPLASIRIIPASFAMATGAADNACFVYSASEICFACCAARLAKIPAIANANTTAFFIVSLLRDDILWKTVGRQQKQEKSAPRDTHPNCAQ